MDNFKLETLRRALEYTEEHLSGDFLQKECAAASMCSLSGLQKLFRYVFHISIGDYVTRRRMTLAARALKSGRSVLDTALDYGYRSPEAFTRAFIRVWGITPQRYAKNRSFTELFPKLDFPQTAEHKGGEVIMKNRFDITELYDHIRSKEGKYVLCFDTCCLDNINKTYGRKAGDAVIRESLNRIEQACGDDMFMFRIGGDEYVLVTDCSEPEEVKSIALSVMSHNGEMINCDGIELPISLRAGAIKLTHDNSTKHSILFNELVGAPSDTPEGFAMD